VSVDEQLTHLKVFAKESILFMCFIIRTLWKLNMVKSTYFILVESMPGKYRKVFNFYYIV